MSSTSSSQSNPSPSPTKKVKFKSNYEKIRFVIEKMDNEVDRKLVENLFKNFGLEINKIKLHKHDTDISDTLWHLLTEIKRYLEIDETTKLSLIILCHTLAHFSFGKHIYTSVVKILITGIGHFTTLREQISSLFKNIKAIHEIEVGLAKLLKNPLI